MKICAYPLTNSTEVERNFKRVAMRTSQEGVCTPITNKQAFSREIC